MMLYLILKGNALYEHHYLLTSLIESISNNILSEGPYSNNLPCCSSTQTKMGVAIFEMPH